MTEERGVDRDTVSARGLMKLEMLDAARPTTSVNDRTVVVLSRFGRVVLDVTDAEREMGVSERHAAETATRRDSKSRTRLRRCENVAWMDAAYE
jgi:hypothetical protein